MQDKQPEQESKCPIHNFFRPKSSRQGIGPITHCAWTSTYVIMEYFNRKLAKDQNVKQAWVGWPKVPGFLYIASKLRYVRSNSLTDPYANKTNDTKEFGAEPEEAKEHYLPDNSFTCDREDPQQATPDGRFANDLIPIRIRPDVEKMTPSALDVSKVCLRKPNPLVPGEDYMEPAGIMNLAGGWGWIQEQDHSFNGNTMKDEGQVRKDSAGNVIKSQCPFLVARAPEEGWPGNVMEMSRTTKDYTRLSDDGRPSVLNERSTAWTQTQVYGTNAAEEAKVRAYSGGKLRVDEYGFLLEDPDKKGIDLVAFNNNYSPPLSFWQWIFVQEHNKLADYFQRLHKDWDDNQLFNHAKLTVAAEVAAEHTRRWTPDLLQHPTLEYAMLVDWYGLFGKHFKMYLMRLSDRHPVINWLLTPFRHNDFFNGMAGSKWEHHDGPNQLAIQFRQVYRTLHDTVPDKIQIFDPKDGSAIGDPIPLLDFIQHNTRDMVKKYGYDALAYSLFTQSCGALTLHNFPRALASPMFINQQTGKPMDLATVDILRERESWKATYNNLREGLGEPPVTTFEELTGGNLEWAQELKLLYGGDINKVDAGIGIRVEPKPPMCALGFVQYFQFILNAPRRIKSNKFLSEFFNYAIYKEGMNWIEHAHGVHGMIHRHLPNIEHHMEGQIRIFAPWENAEEFPKKMYDQTHTDTGHVFMADLRTFGLACVTLIAAACTGALASQTATYALLALFIAPIAQSWFRMLAMRDMREVWKLSTTDKRDTKFGTLYRAERWINRAACFGGVQALAVIIGFQALAWSALHSANPIIALLAAIASLSGAPTWTWSTQFAKDAQVLKVSLRKRMRSGQPAAPATNFDSSIAKSCLTVSTREEFEHMFDLYAPGCKFITAYDFARMHEGNRVSKKRGLLLSLLLLPLLPFEFAAQLFAQLRTDKLVTDFADRIVVDGQQRVPAISKDMLLRVCEGSAQLELKQEKEEGDHDPSPVFIRQ